MWEIGARWRSARGERRGAEHVAIAVARHEEPFALCVALAGKIASHAETRAISRSHKTALPESEE